MNINDLKINLGVYEFHRKNSWYPIQLKDDAEAIKNAENNPGTLKVINAVTRKVVWPLPSIKQEYVLGFLFHDDNKHVVLIRKNKPDWQKGLLNGIGGKVELGEYASDAMRRECEEECGVDIIDWEFFCKLCGKDWIVYCYRYFDSKAFLDAKTMTDEEIVKGAVFIRKDCVSNLLWLIEMALDDNYGKPFNAIVNY
jgi:8-oxo-dGTP diphosphatase